MLRFAQHDIFERRSYCNFTGSVHDGHMPTKDKETSDLNLVLRLYSQLAPYRKTVLGGLLCLIASVACELYPPLIWQRVVDVGLAQRDFNYIALQIVLLLGVLGLNQLFSAIRGILLERAGQRFTLDLRTKLYRKLQAQSAEYYSNNRTGDLISRITSDVESVQDVLVQGTDSVIANALRVIGVAGIFIALQPALGALTVLPMIAVGLLLTRYNKQVRPIYRAARRRLGEISARLSDNISGMRIIQSFAQEVREQVAFESLGRKLYSEQVRAVTLRNRVFPVIRWVGNLGNAIMLGGGVFFIMRGQFTLGGLLAYRGYGRYFLGPIDDLVNINDLLQRAAAAGRRIFEILDASISVVDAPNAPALPMPVRGEIVLDDVSFGYDPANPVLRNVSLHVMPGQRVAILGPSGVGKSTLIGLVARAFDPTVGQVFIDDHDVRQVTLASLRAQVAQVHQETFLFNATVLDNLRYGRPDATLAEAEAAAKAANAHMFIEALPQGYETVVGERGVKLSGGQRQRIAVARALLSPARVLLLDEPTSAVEPESEALIIEGLERLMQGRTSLIVSHRLSLARSADIVVIVAEGRIVEQGNPDALLAQPNSRFGAMVRADSAFLDEPTAIGNGQVVNGRRALEEIRE
jgi:ABC-type multidrug transport system fused ATPase/permease subunit